MGFVCVVGHWRMDFANAIAVGMWKFNETKMQNMHSAYKSVWDTRVCVDGRGGMSAGVLKMCIDNNTEIYMHILVTNFSN